MDASGTLPADSPLDPSAKPVGFVHNVLWNWFGISDLLRRIIQRSVFRRPVIGFSSRHTHNPLPGYLDAGSYRDLISPAGHPMLMACVEDMRINAG